MLNRRELYQIRKEKIRNEIIAARRILNQETEPLKIGEILIHNAFELLRDSFLNKFPEIKEEELHQKIKQTLLLVKKFKSKKKRKYVYG